MIGMHSAGDGTDPAIFRSAKRRISRPDRPAPEAETALVIGATSDIGRAVARQLAAGGWTLQLAGRNAARLRRTAQDLKVRTGATITLHRCNVLQDDHGLSLLDTLDPLPQIAVCVVGLLGDQAVSQGDGRAAAQVMHSNYVGPALLMGALAECLERRGSGTLVGVSSVAGERGRVDNYVYGSAKAGFTAFLSGLRNRCAASGVHVVTIKLGFVRTRMTDGMTLPARLTATPGEVATAMLKAIRHRRDVVYVRRIWRGIVFVMRALPERVFKRLWQA